jgi:hypothetical protein
MDPSPEHQALHPKISDDEAVKDYSESSVAVSTHCDDATETPDHSLASSVTDAPDGAEASVPPLPLGPQMMNETSLPQDQQPSHTAAGEKMQPENNDCARESVLGQVGTQQPAIDIRSFMGRIEWSILYDVGN